MAAPRRPWSHRVPAGGSRARAGGGRGAGQVHFSTDRLVKQVGAARVLISGAGEHRQVCLRPPPSSERKPGCIPTPAPPRPASAHRAGAGAGVFAALGRRQAHPGRRRAHRADRAAPLLRPRAPARRPPRRVALSLARPLRRRRRRRQRQRRGAHQQRPGGAIAAAAPRARGGAHGGGPAGGRGPPLPLAAARTRIPGPGGAPRARRAARAARVALAVEPSGLVEQMAPRGGFVEQMAPRGGFVAARAPALRTRRRAVGACERLPACGLGGDRPGGRRQRASWSHWFLVARRPRRPAAALEPRALRRRVAGAPARDGAPRGRDAARAAGREDGGAHARGARAVRCLPPPPPFVLTGHVASFTPY